jgi:ubiquinone/menaquinone biosynthesis C-methylase UbiE
MRMATPRERFTERVQHYSEARVGLYNAATEAQPHARATERQLLLDLLDLEPGMAVCDTMAGGGYLADGIFASLGGRCRITCVEPSEVFARSISPRYARVVCPLDAIALADGSFERVTNLAGTHHIDRKAEFFREAHRVLASGGRFAVADVLAGSAAADFLNGAVDRWSDIGHDGTFLAHGELSRLLNDAGFVEVREAYHAYTWDFPDEDSLVQFCRSLFRMTRASLVQVHDEVSKALTLTSSSNGRHMAWSLVYACGTRA